MDMLEDPRFWADWFLGRDEDDGEPFAYEGKRIELRPSAAGPALIVELGELPRHGALFLVTEDGTSIELAIRGVADDAPHALRWEEVDVIARALALRGDHPHPGPVVALLGAFAPICETDDADAIAPLLDATFGTCGVADDARLLFYTYDRRNAGFRWRRLESRWVLDQTEAVARRCGLPLYTMRREETEFPHAQLDRLVAEAMRVVASAVEPPWRQPHVRELAARFAAGDLDAAPALGRELRVAGCTNQVLLDGLESGSPASAAWIVELVADAPWGTIVAAHFGPTEYAVLPRHAITLELPPGSRRELSFDTDRFDVQWVSSAFRDRQKVLDQYSLIGWGEDLDELIREAESTLRAAEVPAGTALRWFGEDAWQRRVLEPGE